ncbi:diguanylate cyclase [Pelomonas sp. SE-A7]|uniref:sensor domain-containing diguanylate cyclase n=1 Tax=Pelomonas sp. SE-A7 TaxID=3054953 RepID=UPI00259CFC97|nr:diguanylate cyclase [Pelomonas sp. SE-A7]MDM4767757.1 diguanylate cyclase [Pelomonas sp. SE-A7]
MPVTVDPAPWRLRLNSSPGRIVAAAGLVLVLLAFNVALLLQLEYRSEAERIQVDADRGAQKLASHASNVLDRAARTLDLLQRLRGSGEGGLRDAAQLLGNGGVAGWLVVDARGNLIASGGRELPASVSARPFFRRAAKLSDAALDLAETEVLPGGDPRPVLPMSRRLSGPDGSFVGAVTALIALDDLTAAEEQAGLSGTFTLVGADGRVRARLNDGKLSHGELIDLESLRKRQAQARAELEPLPSRLDGQLRFLALAEPGRYPLLAAVGLEAESALASYRDHRMRILTTGGLVGLLLLGAAWLLILQARRLASSGQLVQSAESRLRATLEGSLDAVLMMRAERNAQGRLDDLTVIDANSRAARLLDVREPIGRRFCELLPSARDSGMLNEFELALASGQTLLSERAAHSPHLHDHWLQHQIVPLEDGVALFTRDISERKAAEVRLDEQRSFLQSLLDYLPIPVFARSLRGANRGDYLFWNRAAERGFHRRRDEVIGHKVRDIVADAEDARRYEQQDLEVQAGGVPRHYPDQHFDSPEGRRYFDMLKAPVFGSDGLPDYVLVIAEDVTEKRGSAERLRLASRVLAEIGDAVLLTDAQDRVIDCNPAFSALTGRAAAQLLGRPATECGLPPVGELDPNTQRWVGESLLMCADGRVLDIWLSVGRISDADGRPSHQVRVFSDISALKRHQEELDEMARLDSLTGLPNRRSFDERLAEALARSGRSGHLLGLLFVDLDGFKKVNDTLGHAAGDQLLCGVAERLKACVRSVDSVCRLGGDEFTVIVEDAGSQADVGRLCERILELLGQPHLLAAGRPVVTPSIGVAMATPGEAPDSLLRRADDAMYAAKRGGKGRYCVARPLE